MVGLLAGLDNPVWGLGSWPNIGEYFVEQSILLAKNEPVRYQYFFTQRSGAFNYNWQLVTTE